jgi:hypothetical protein
VSQGWIKLHRKIREHWLYEEGRKFSKYEAWLYLLMEANHAANKFMYEGTLVSVERGQFITSKLKLAECWNWDRSTVSRFLKTLTDEGMISIKASNRMTVLSICKYDTYQDKPPTDPATDAAIEPTTHAATGTATPQQPAPTNKNDQELIKNDQESARPSGLIKVREHVWVNPVSIDQWRVVHSPAVVERALDLLNGDIEQARATLDFEKKRRLGKHGAAGALQKWGFSAARKQLEDEKPRASKFPQEAPRPQPKEFVPPKYEQHNPEQRARNLELLKKVTQKVKSVPKEAQ